VHRFRTPKQLVAYIGLNPRVLESGNSAANGPIAHYGRKDLRALLIQAATRCFGTRIPSIGGPPPGDS